MLDEDLEDDRRVIEVGNDYSDKEYHKEEGGGGVYEKLEDHETEDGIINKNHFNMFDEDYKWS